MNQAESDDWMRRRWPRMTALQAKTIYGYGKKLLNGEHICPEKMIERKLWPNGPPFQSGDMLYGIQEEAAARQKYTEVTGLEVSNTGLWVNTAMVHLGASPDGIFQHATGLGIIEIKCLKVLRETSVEDLIQNVRSIPPKVSISSQCFVIFNDTLRLKRKHPYYYQIQQQLLVTGAVFCDFVLHSPKGPPAIHRIFPNVRLHHRLLRNTYAFWKKVYVPEYFLKRIPRDLNVVDFPWTFNGPCQCELN